MVLRLVSLACLADFGLAARMNVGELEKRHEEKLSAIAETKTEETWGALGRLAGGFGNLNNLRDECESHWCRFTRVMASYAIESFRLERAANSWSAPSVQELQTPLLAAKLCQASYEDRATVEEVVAAEGMQLLTYTPQWWITSKPNGQIFVVFRGTADLHDVLVDVLVRPTEYNGAMWHTGFLQQIQMPDLQGALRHYANSPRVTVVGHSLGGANAYALAASGLMPVGHIEEVITFGAPAVIYADSSDHVNKNFRHTAFAHNADPVPRLLGSDPVVLGALLSLFRDQGSGVETPRQSILEAVSLYGQEGNAIWLKGSNGRPHQVPSGYLPPVMHLQTIMSVTAPPRNPLGDHLMAGYRNGIEIEIQSGGSQWNRNRNQAWR